MYCPKCGTDNPDVAKFCGNCSAPLAAAQVGTAPPYPGTGTGAGSGSGTGTGGGEVVSSGKKWGIGILSVLIPLVGIIMGIIYMADANPEKKSAGKLWLILSCGIVAVYCLIGLAGRS